MRSIVRSPRRRPEVESVDVEGELVLWDPAGRSVHRLDPVGSLLWPFLDGESTVEELAADAAAVWSIPVDAAETAICALVEQLDEAGLLGGAVDVEPRPSPAYLVDPPSP